MCRGLIAITLLATVFCAWAQDGASEPANYLVEVNMYRVPEQACGGVLASTATEQELAGIISDDSSQVVEMGDLLLHRDTGDLGWRSAPHQDDPPIVALARPRLVLQPDTPGEVALGEGPAEYFERVDGERADLFVHRLSETSTGFRLKVTVSPGGEDRVRLWLHLRTVFLAEREPIEGVGLDVGKPVFSGDSEEDEETWTNVICRLGDWLILSQWLPEDDRLLTLIRVQPHGAPQPREAWQDDGVQYEVRMHVFDAPAKRGGKLFESLKLDDTVTPTAGTARLVRGIVPKKGPAPTTLQALSQWLVDEGHERLIAPEVLIGLFDPEHSPFEWEMSPFVKPKSPIPDPMPGAPEQLDGLFDPPLDQGSNKIAVIASFHEVPTMKNECLHAYDINGDGITEIIPFYRKDAGTRYDWRGFIAGVRPTPVEEPGHINLEFGYATRDDVGKNGKGASGNSGEPLVEECRFGFDFPIELGQWVGFTDEMPTSKRRVLVLVQVDGREVTPAAQATSPPATAAAPESGQASTEQAAD